MTRDQFISLFFFALLIFIVHQVFLIFLPFVRAIFWSAILTFAFYPVYLRVRRLLAPRETVAAILMTVVIFLIVIPPVVMLLVNVTAQAVELYQTASNYIGQGGLERLVERVRRAGLVRHFEERFGEVELLKRHASTWILATSRAVGNFAAQQFTTLTKNLFLVGLNVVFMAFLIFIFLKDGEKIYSYIYQITPLEEKNKRPIFRRVNETFSAVIRGQLLTSFTQAVVAGIVYWMLGIPLPLFFATLTFLMALIPVVGASTVWVPLVIYLITLDEMSKAVALALTGTLVISLIDNVMKPALIGEKTKLPYFMLFFGILGGIKVYGLMGIFIAPVVLSLFFALVKIYQENR